MYWFVNDEVENNFGNCWGNFNMCWFIFYFFVVFGCVINYNDLMFLIYVVDFEDKKGIFFDENVKFIVLLLLNKEILMFWLIFM